MIPTGPQKKAPGEAPYKTQPLNRAPPEIYNSPQMKEFAKSLQILLGELLYFAKHSCEFIPDLLMFGLTRFDPDAPWYMKCMESRFWKLMGGTNDKLKDKCILCYTYLEMAAVAPQEFDRPNFFIDGDFPGLATLQRKYINALQSTFSDLVTGKEKRQKLKDAYYKEIADKYGVRDIVYLDSGICGEVSTTLGNLGGKSE